MLNAESCYCFDGIRGGGPNLRRSTLRGWLPGTPETRLDLTDRARPGALKGHTRIIALFARGYNIVRTLLGLGVGKDY